MFYVSYGMLRKSECELLCVTVSFTWCFPLKHIHFYFSFFWKLEIQIRYGCMIPVSLTAGENFFSYSALQCTGCSKKKKKKKKNIAATIYVYFLFHFYR